MAGTNYISLANLVGTTLTLEVVGLTELVAALSGSSNAQAFNLVVQTGATVSGVAADLFPPAIVPTIILSEIGVVTGLAVLTEDQNQAILGKNQLGAATVHDLLTVEGDLVTVVGDLVSAVGGLLNTNPLTKPAGILASAFGVGLNIYSAKLLIEDVSQSAALNAAINNQISKVNSAILDSSSEINKFFGNAGATVVSLLGDALNKIESTLDINNPNFLTNISSAAAAIKNVNDSFATLFDALGLPLSSVSENATGASTTSVVLGNSLAETRGCYASHSSDTCSNKLPN